MTCQVGVKGGDADLDAHLVVALAGAAVGHGVGPFSMGRLHQVTGDERASQGGGQGVLVFIDRTGLESREQEVPHQGIPPVHGKGLRRPHLQRPLPDGLQVHHAQVDGQGNHVGVIVLLEPGNGNRCVQPAAVGEDDFVFSHW